MEAGILISDIGYQNCGLRPSTSDLRYPTSDTRLYNQFVGQLDQAIARWRVNNNGKVPSDSDIIRIGRDVLSPNQSFSSADTPVLRTRLTRDDWRDRDAVPTTASHWPNNSATNYSISDDKNTSTNINTDTNVIESNPKREQEDTAVDSRDTSMLGPVWTLRMVPSVMKTATGTRLSPRAPG